MFFRYNKNVKKKRNFNSKKIFITGIVIVCSVGVLSLIFNTAEQSVPHQNLVDMKISQYSDKHITQNAIKTDSEFKNIAFETPPAETIPLFSNQIAAVIRAFKLLIKSPAAEQTGPKEYGTWIWTPVMEMTQTYIDSIITEAKANNMNTIYISIDSYLDIFVMQKGTERERQKKLFSDKLEYFIKQAGKNNIAVDAEAGWRNWAEGDNIYKAYAVVNYVKNFNATRESKFRGLQYDIEPYLLDSYKINKADVLKDFVTLIDKTGYFLAESTLKFAVVVPDFYDGKDEMTPEFFYNKKQDYVLGHLLDVLDKRPDSSIIIMSYRSFAEGSDGSIEISKNEMQTAKRGAYRTKIIIAQETGDVPPPYITFYNTSKKYLRGQINIIDSAFAPNPNFGGIAIHYANTFLALK
jgi:hypothetical protein